jgi:hypothetical protein
MSPRSNVKLDSLAAFAAIVPYSILEGKLGEIDCFFSQQRQWRGVAGWQPMAPHSAANKRVALTLFDENFLRTLKSAIFYNIHVEASLEIIITLLSGGILHLHTSLRP